MAATNPKYFKIIDLLEQIERLNEIVALHEHSGDDSSLKQYVFLRDDFSAKLDKVLKSFAVDNKELIKAGGERSDGFYAPVLKEEKVDSNSLPINSRKISYPKMKRIAKRNVVVPKKNQQGTGKS